MYCKAVLVHMYPVLYTCAAAVVEGFLGATRSSNEKSSSSEPSSDVNALLLILGAENRSDARYTRRKNNIIIEYTSE